MDKKVERIINLYSSFLEGKVVNKKEEAERFEVNQRTIQRDIDDIRMCFANDMKVNWQVVYDRNKNGYVLVREGDTRLNSQEIFMLCEVFLKSRILAKEEMISVVDKLVQTCVSREEKQKVISLLAKEKMQYEGLEQETISQQLIKNFNDAVYTQRVVRIQHLADVGKEPVWQSVQPIGIVFSGKHFYLTAYVHTKEEEKKYVKDKQSVVYRLDKIMDYRVLQEHFHVPYKNQYEETDFYKLIESEISATGE
ncbi:MAG: WYL domain-containing protein [Lachnospiraceae bacterium]|nr:WYL domain-containing protein [Lachnospiraceae bacterium]